MQAWDSFVAAGCAKHLLYARIEARRFGSIQSAKADQTFFKWMNFKAEATSGSTIKRPRNAANGTKDSSSTRLLCPTKQAIGVEICRVAADTFGVELSGVE